MKWLIQRGEFPVVAYSFCPARCPKKTINPAVPIMPMLGVDGSPC
jgi:hypothetical protein